jgi:hypothetical protein
VVNIGTSRTTVVSKTVPAGSYAINAKLLAVNTDTTATQAVDCFMAATGFNVSIALDTTSATLPKNAPPAAGRDTMALQTATTFTNTTTVSVICSRSGGTADVTALQMRLSLIRVGAIS